MFVAIDLGRAAVATGSAKSGSDQLGSLADDIQGLAASVGMEFEGAQAVRPLRDGVDLAHDTALLIARKMVEIREADTGFAVADAEAAAANLVELCAAVAPLITAVVGDGNGGEGGGDDADDDGDGGEGGVGGFFGSLWNSGSDAVGDVADGIGDLGDAAIDFAGDAADYVGDKVNDAKAAAIDIANATVGKIADFADMVVDAASRLAGATFDRLSTLVAYELQSSARRSSNPFQTMWDNVTGTTFIEKAAAWEAILVEDGELYYGDADGYCGTEADCIYGVWTPPGTYGITLGHTVRFSADDPTEIKDYQVAHETQHVFDNELMGFSAFGGAYLTEFAIGFQVRAIDKVINGGRTWGEVWDDSYKGITTEQRAYEVSDNYDEGVRPSHGGPVWPDP